MDLQKTIIEGKTFTLHSQSKKFRLGKSKNTVGGLLEEQGGAVINFSNKKEPYDYVLIGRETENFSPHRRKVAYIFEGELLDRTHISQFEYFPDLDIKFYDMLRTIFKEDNIDISCLSIGNPLTESDFLAYEKKLKRKIPKAVKEFYSVFGEIKLLWKFRKPYERSGIRVKGWNIDYYDNHFGSFQILPLKTVLFEKWNNPDYCLEVGEDLKIFDFSYDFYPMAFDLSEEGNPTVYKGDDHGVVFEYASNFKQYIGLMIHLHGARIRYDHLSTDFTKTPINIDFSNQKNITARIDELKETVQGLIESKDFKAAKEQSYSLYDLEPNLYYRFNLDIARGEKDIDAFIRNLKDLLREGNFDLSAYEKELGDDEMFKTANYLAFKDGLANS